MTYTSLVIVCSFPERNSSHLRIDAHGNFGKSRSSPESFRRLEFFRCSTWVLIEASHAENLHFCRRLVLKTDKENIPVSSYHDHEGAEPANDASYFPLLQKTSEKDISGSETASRRPHTTNDDESHHRRISVFILLITVSPISILRSFRLPVLPGSYAQFIKRSSCQSLHKKHWEFSD